MTDNRGRITDCGLLDDSMFPLLVQEWERMNSGTLLKYQLKLEEGCEKAVKMLTDLIDSDQLSLDLEQAVAGFKAMTEAQARLLDSKRKLAETMLKGALMVEALKPPKETKTVSLLDNYVGQYPARIGSERSSSIFTDIDRMASKKPEKEPASLPDGEADD